MSPTVLRSGPYRFFFYSNEGSEPPHVHIQEGRKLAKYWLDSCEIAASKGFASYELTAVQQLVSENRERLLEKWHEFVK